MPKNNIRTSKDMASKAADLLKKGKSLNEKKVAASALVNRKQNTKSKKK